MALRAEIRDLVRESRELMARIGAEEVDRPSGLWPGIDAAALEVDG